VEADSTHASGERSKTDSDHLVSPPLIGELDVQY
jgi:hypothetical protein